MIVDVVAPRRAVIAWLGERGFVIERPFARMRLSAAPVSADATLMAVAGPEFG